MKNLNYLILSGFFFLLAACGASKDAKTEKILASARQIHNEAMKLHNEVMPQLREIKSFKEKTQEKIEILRKKTNVTAEELKPFEILLAELDNKQKAMNDWMANIQEVPGNEEEHHHHEGDGHDHKHESATKATPDEMLAYQQEMKKNITQIKADFKTVLAEAADLLK
jgi:ABC-type nickel/cobalt efflux system permease component RcnA